MIRVVRKQMRRMLTIVVVVVSMLILIAGTWRAANFLDAMFESESELRARLSAGDIAVIEQYGRELLLTSSTSTEIGDQLPPAIRQLGVQWAVTVPASEYEPAHVHVEFGGGHHHYGLLITLPDDQLPATTHGRRYSRWSDGVWFHEDTE